MRRRTIPTLVLALAAAAPSAAQRGAIPIWQPTAITEPGDYVVTREITATTGPTLDIQTADVRVDLNGHTLTRSGSGGPVILISGPASGEAAGLRLANGTIRGGQHGIASGIQPCVRVALSDLVIRDAADTAVRLQALEQLEATGIIIVGGKIGFDLGGQFPPDPIRPLARIADSGIQADLGVRCTGVACNLTGNTVSSCNAAFELNGAKTSVVSRNVTLTSVASCFFNPQPEPPGRHIRLLSSPNAIVSGNTVRAEGSGAGLLDHHGIYVDAGSAGALVEENVVRGFAHDGVHVVGDGSVVRGNLVSGNGRHGIRLGGFNVLAEGNQAAGNSGDGIHFATSGHVFRHNVLRNNASAIGGAGLGDATDGGGNVP